MTKYQVYHAVFHVDEKFTHQVIYFSIKLCVIMYVIKLSISYVKVKIYTSSLLHCYQLPSFNLKYMFVHQSERRYCNVSFANIFMPSSPSFINQEGLVSSFLLMLPDAHVLAGTLKGKQ